MSGNVAKVSDLSDKERRALLSTLINDEKGGAESFAVSFAQQRLWFLAQLEPDNPSYNLPQILRLKGELNVDALEQTINAIIARHESLRTTFKEVDGEPVQIVSDVHEIKLGFTDLKGLPESEREDEAQRLAVAEVRRPFDLSRDYPLRAVLVRLDEDDHWLLLTMHHIVSDGWSLGIFTRELANIYGALATNQEISLSELPIQYPDFAEWQREWLQGEVLDEHLDYWLKSLAGAPAMLKLPTDHPRPAQQSFKGASVTLKLSPQLSKSLVELSQRQGVTLFMTTLAAFQTLLFRYTGQEDIVVGTPIAGRNREEIEGLIGFFVNTLALRTNVSGNPTFRQLLARVKEIALGAYAHQDLPFEKLVEALNPERDVSHSPVFQVMFGMQNVPRDAPALNGLSITRVPLPSVTAKFDLTLFISETATGLNCWLEYNTDLFEKATVSRMLRHFEHLLEMIVTDPNRPILRLPLLTSAERARLLTEQNGAESDFPKQSIHTAFEKQVEGIPNSVAVVTEYGKLTYADLDRRANQLAHHLQKSGVGPGELVGLCIERSPEMLVSLLGILKAGAAYLPLDPSYPQERLSLMLEDGKIKVLLTLERLQEKLPPHTAKTVFIDRDWEAIARESADRFNTAATTEDLAYVMYTSGSTGKPKAVAVTHQSVLRLVKQTNYAKLGADEVFLQFAPLSFDASTFEIWGSLLNGGKLVLMPPGLVSLAQLGETIKHNGVTTLWLTAGLFQQMVETELESLRGLRQLLAGGDALPVPHVEQVARELKDCQLINGYGPTENTTFTCCYPVQRGERFAGNVPIGFPISNTQVYILDTELEPVPVGVVGELYTGGAGLAIGYLNDAALTAERFVPNPFSAVSGTRLYRTGDYARLKADGSIEYMGRIDQQVKLRGHRIELAEIEGALKQHAAVRDAVVVMRRSEHGNKHLIAYVIANSALPESKMSGELKSVLKQSLPEYMVPSYFVFVEEFPLTPNGKIDRRALPVPPETRPELEEAHIAPRDDLETRLARIWERVLEVKSVGVRDNFFELGGHSLLAVRLVSEIEKELGQRLPLVSFFQGATIEYLAGLLRQGVSSISWPTLVKIQTDGSKAPLICVSMPNVNALGYRSVARYLGNDQPVFGLQAQYPEDLEGEHSQAAVDSIATEYLEALRAVQPNGPYQFIGLCRGAHIAFEMARRLEREGQKIAFLGIIDTWVMENTYNYFWQIEYHARRFAWLTLLSLKNKLSFVKRKAGNNGETGLPVITGSAGPKQKPFKVYFPGPDYVPTRYGGRIAVFRARHQPRNRIRDFHLGWSKLAKGGVDVHFIPGDHSSVLKEPHVQGLAAALKKCLHSEQNPAD
jgi:amino acid adenylation domain-containing protein